MESHVKNIEGMKGVRNYFDHPKDLICMWVGSWGWKSHVCSNTLDSQWLRFDPFSLTKKNVGWWILHICIYKRLMALAYCWCYNYYLDWCNLQNRACSMVHFFALVSRNASNFKHGALAKQWKLSVESAWSMLCSVCCYTKATWLLYQ